MPILIFQRYSAILLAFTTVSQVLKQVYIFICASVAHRSPSYLHTYLWEITYGTLSNYIRIPERFIPYLLEITPVLQRDYSRIPERLPPYSILFIYILPSIYSRIPERLHTYSILFTLGSCIIDILEKSNYHRDDTNLSSRWNVCIIMMKLIFHHDDNSISRFRKQWEYVYK